MSSPELVRDCARCAALCCIAHSFSSSADFAFDKGANEPCRHLTTQSRCRIHASLVDRGMRGCAVYDCHGAGQRVTAKLRVDGAPDVTDDVLEIFRVVHVLHEQMALLTQAAKLPVPETVASEIDGLVAAMNTVADAPASQILSVDLRPLLRRVDDIWERMRSLGVVSRKRRLPVVDHGDAR